MFTEGSVHGFVYIVKFWGARDAYDTHKFARANSAGVTNKINELARVYHPGRHPLETEGMRKRYRPFQS